MNALPTAPIALTFVRQEGIELTTMAILLVRSAHATKDDTMAALEAAVTKWVETTELGRSVWESSCSDLNIGDLNGHDAFFDPDFTKILADNGIAYVDCHMADSESAFSFDRVLAHPETPLPDLQEAVPVEPQFATIKELAKLTNEEDRKASPVITLTLNEFDDQGIAVDTSTCDVTVNQASEIIDHAAQLVLLQRERKPVTQVLAQLDAALSDAEVIRAAPDVRQWAANATNTDRDQWEFIEGRDTGVGTDYWMRNTVTGVVAYACVDQGEVISLSVEADDDPVYEDDEE